MTLFYEMWIIFTVYLGIEKIQETPTILMMFNSDFCMVLSDLNIVFIYSYFVVFLCPLHVYIVKMK